MRHRPPGRARRVRHASPREARRVPADRPLWERKARLTLDRYVARGVPEVAAIRAGLRDLTLRGISDLPEGRLMVEWLEARLEDALAQGPG